MRVSTIPHQFGTTQVEMTALGQQMGLEVFYYDSEVDMVYLGYSGVALGRMLDFNYEMAIMFAGHAALFETSPTGYYFVAHTLQTGKYIGSDFLDAMRLLVARGFVIPFEEAPPTKEPPPSRKARQKAKRKAKRAANRKGEKTGRRKMETVGMVSHYAKLKVRPTIICPKCQTRHHVGEYIEPLMNDPGVAVFACGCGQSLEVHSENKDGLYFDTEALKLVKAKDDDEDHWTTPDRRDAIMEQFGWDPSNKDPDPNPQHALELLDRLIG